MGEVTVCCGGGPSPPNDMGLLLFFGDDQVRMGMVLFRGGYGKAGGDLLSSSGLAIYRGYRLSCQEMVQIQSMGSFWGIWGSGIVGAIDCGSAGVRNADIGSGIDHAMLF